MITNFFIPELNNHDVQELWFQQDGATCHTARATIDLLIDTDLNCLPPSAKSLAVIALNYEAGMNNSAFPWIQRQRRLDFAVPGRHAMFHAEDNSTPITPTSTLLGAKPIVK
ncbi:hypothetical protein TNCV_3737471 [Trichonephila clavipes]|nr:hypothetical protein TNCV_3737471 [Trichonephila clavipes]